MMKNNSGKKAAGVNEETVLLKTGRKWAEWLTILDAAGAQTMNHKQIVAYIAEYHNISSWWQQQITVAYEQARGLRKLHEKPDGFEISRSKTLPAGVESCWLLWEDAAERQKWLPDITVGIRKATLYKTLRLDWKDGQTRLNVAFYPKAGGKTQVTVQHIKLASTQQAEEMKVFWSEALNRLQLLLAKEQS